MLSVWLYVDSADGHTIVSGAFYRDRWTALGQIILCGIGLATTLVGVEHVPGWGRNADPARRDDHIAEFYALLLASAAGMTFFVGAGNLMTLFLSLEWFSIALYVMCAIDYDLEGSLEAGLKYLIVGSFGAAALLFGSALVYGATGTISFHGIAAAIAAQGLTGDSFARRRNRADRRGARLQDVRRAVPHVDAGRLRGRADDGDRVDVVGDEGRGAPPRVPPDDDGVPARRAASGAGPSRSSRPPRSRSATSRRSCRGT